MQKNKACFFSKQVESIFFYTIKAPEGSEHIDDKMASFIPLSTVSVSNLTLHLKYPAIAADTISLPFLFLSKDCYTSMVKHMAILTPYILKKKNVTKVGLSQTQHGAMVVGQQQFPVLFHSTLMSTLKSPTLAVTHSC